MADGVVIRAADGCATETSVLWDSVWNADLGGADWALAGAAESNNRGGLSAQQAIFTAATLALFTDARCDPLHPLAYLADGDRRGYFGDGVDVRADLGETPLGSLLWLLERAPLTVRGESISRWAEQFALDALSPIKAQGAVARIDVTATANELAGRLELVVRLFASDGAAVFDHKFDVLWNQVAR